MAGQVLRKVTGGAAVSIPAWLAGMSARDLDGALVVVLLVAAVLCWAIADEGRSRRLAWILNAWRGRGLPQPAEARPESTPAKRRKDQATRVSGDPATPDRRAAGTG
jgi:hypothetical protein